MHMLSTKKCAKCPFFVVRRFAEYCNRFEFCSMRLLPTIIVLCLLGPRAHGQSWQATSAFPNQAASDLLFADDQLWLSTYDGQIFRSNNEGQSWIQVPLPAPTRTIYTLHQSSNRWFASTDGGFYTSNNSGQSWQWVAIPGLFAPSGFAVLGNGHWVVATADLEGGTASGNGVMRSTNNGQSWESVTANLPGTGIAKMLQSDNDQLVVALHQPAQTAGLFTTWLGSQGTFQWMELPIRLFYQTDSSWADFQASEWFELQWYNDSTLLVSADGTVQETGSTNGVYTQFMGYRRINTGGSAERWVETLPFRPQVNSWWDQAAPANLLRHSETNHWYGSLQGGSARGGAWMRPSAAQGWSRANNGIPPGQAGWHFLKFAEGPLGRVFAIHQGQAGVYFTDHSRRWPTFVPAPEASSLKVWPNPGSGRVHLNATQEAALLQLFSPHGQLVWEQNLEASENGMVDLSHLPPGVYALRLLQGQLLKQAMYVHRP